MFEYVLRLLKNQERTLRKDTERWNAKDIKSFRLPEKISELQKAILILEREEK